MTELSPELFENAKRNDPCPCGSGKKFKKCHERTLRLTKEAEKKTRGIAQLVGSDTIAYQIFKLLQQIRENNMLNLFWEFGHEQGPFRERFSELTNFLEAAERGDEKLPADKDFDLRRIRIDGPDVYLLLTRGHRDPKLNSVHFEVVVLRPNEVDESRGARSVDERGWRLWDLQRHEKPKADLKDFDLALEDLGYTWADAWQRPAELDVVEAVAAEPVAADASETVEA